jgi:ABC-type transporter Mla maintaining outer membrane lipid asymmetry permease subunit MlaE
VHSMVLRDILTCLVKSLAFATIIVHVGCLEGFRAAGNR